jgi:hypothetical protein
MDEVSLAWHVLAVVWGWLNHHRESVSAALLLAWVGCCVAWLVTSLQRLRQHQRR